MKKFSQTLIPTLAVTISALLVTISLTTMNIANANSFALSSVQLQPPHQQQDTNRMNVTTKSNELPDNPLPFLPSFQQSQSQPLQPQQQQQTNQSARQNPLNANGISNTHNDVFDNHSPTIVSILPF